MKLEQFTIEEILEIAEQFKSKCDLKDYEALILAISACKIEVLGSIDHAISAIADKYGAL